MIRFWWSVRRIVRNKRKININVSPQVQKRLRSVLLLTTCETWFETCAGFKVQSGSLTLTVSEALACAAGYLPPSCFLINGTWLSLCGLCCIPPSWRLRMPPLLGSLRKPLFFSPRLLFLFCFSLCPLFPPHGSIFGAILQSQTLGAFLELSFLPRSGIMFQASELFGRR